MEVLDEREIANEFPDEHLMMIRIRGKDDRPWYADFVNFIVGKKISEGLTSDKKRRFLSLASEYFWDEPYAFKICPDNIIRRCVDGDDIPAILAHCHSGPIGGHHSVIITKRKILDA